MDIDLDWTSLYCITNEKDVNELFTHHFIDQRDVSELYVFKNHKIFICLNQYFKI